MASEHPEAPLLETKRQIPYVRLAITGAFMGMANLVPGVSGGTMVLALGLYDEFIDSMASVTRFKFTWRSVIVLAMLFGISALTILLLSSMILLAMELFQPGMLGLFIGMTLGGAPMLFKQLKPLDGPSIASAAAGFALMAAIAIVLDPGSTNPNFFLLLIGGIVGSAAMILPGISGSYMLLIMGLYLPIIAGVSAIKDAMKAMVYALLGRGDASFGEEFARFFGLSMTIALPVGIGLLIGIVILSNLLRFMLVKYHRPTIGFLLGLLLGSVLGLYPFAPASFDKLPRYATTDASGKAALVVRGYGFEVDHPVGKKLAALGRDGMNVLISTLPDAMPALADIESARIDKAVIVVYGKSPSPEIRRAASESEAKIQLIVVPNSEFTVPKGIMVVFLMLLGFGLTIFLGRFGGEGDTPPEEPLS